MTQNLKIEVLTGDISIDGMVVTNLVTKEELSTAIVKKADLGTDGKIPTSQLPAEIVNTAGIVDEVKLQLETSIKDAVDESNAYAESYTDNALSSKADLTSGKVPLEQLPAIDQYPQFGTALSSLSTSILTSVKQRTDQLEKSKADLGEDGKVLREQIPSYEKISGLPEQLEVMSTQTAAVSGELDEHKLQMFDQVDALKENIDSNSKFLMESMTERLENYADKDAVKRGIANRYDSSLTYNSGERVVLTNGDIVKSTVAGNTVDPNVDMTGWELADSALNSQKLKRENVSVWDFFTAEELTAYKANPTTYDASEQVQAFFDYCHANKVINANAGGEFYITKPINYTGSNHATNVMLGDLKLTTDKPLNYMLHITGQGFQYLGLITLLGAGGSASQRKTRCGLLLGYPVEGLTTLQPSDCYSTNLFIQAIEVGQVYDVGVYWGNFSHFSAIGRLRGASIGSCGTDNWWVSNDTTFSAVATVEGDINQSSTLTVDKLPYDSSGTALAYINNQLYSIIGVNKATNTITVYPRLPRNVNTGTIWYQQGSVLFTIGNDTSNLRVNTLQAITCGIGADFKALYGCNISTFISEYLGAGIVLSDKYRSTTIGNHVTSGYFEANIADIVYGWFGSSTMLSIAANVALNPAKIISLAPFRQSDDSLAGGGYALAGGDIFLDDTTYNAANNTFTGDLTHASKVHFHHFWGDFTLNISQNLDKWRLFGKHSAMYVFAGAYATSAPGIITINPPSGSVINNAAQMTIDATKYDSAIVVYIYAISSTNYLASVITPKIQSVV